jgi:hypothetical protein
VSAAKRMQGTTRCVCCGSDRGERNVCCSQYTFEDGTHFWPACRRCCWNVHHDPRAPSTPSPDLLATFLPETVVLHLLTARLPPIRALARRP